MDKWDWSGTLRPLRNALGFVFLVALALSVIEGIWDFPKIDEFSLAFLAALWEDLLFFAIIGLALYVIQKQEVDQKRTFADRLFILTNARKALSSKEKESLKELVANVLSYVHHDKIEIRIEQFIEAAYTLQMRVVRNITFANYTTDLDATHSICLSIEQTGCVEGHPLTLDPVKTVELKPRASVRDKEKEVLLEAMAVNGKLEQMLKSNRIGGGNHRLYEIRYTTWVDLKQQDGLFFHLKTRKYSQNIMITIRNDTAVDLGISYKRENESASHITIEHDSSTENPILLDDVRAGETCEFRITAPVKA